MTAPAPSTSISAAMSRVAITVRIAPSSEPGANAEDEAQVTRALSGSPRKIRRLPEFPLINNADIGREFPVEFVAQPEAGIDIGKPGADETCGVSLAVNIELDLRLQDEPLRQDKVVGGLQLACKMTLAAYKPVTSRSKK